MVRSLASRAAAARVRRRLASLALRVGSRWAADGVQRADSPSGTRQSPTASLDPRRHGTVLVDAADVDGARLGSSVQQLAASLPDRRLVVVHGPDATIEDLADMDVELISAGADRDGLAARFGAARHVRVLPVGDLSLAALSAPVQLTKQAPPPDSGADGVPAGPVFVGGTGRSGTWVLGRLLGSHPRWLSVHTELRFHSAPPGFAAVLLGKITPEQYASIVEEKWFGTTGGTGKAKGLQLILAVHELRRALKTFVEGANDDVPAALGQLMMEVVERYMRGRSAVGFTETTPDNAAAADSLTTVLPTARVVHVVRDGRDVASSVATMAWGPNDPDSGLDWWAKRLSRVHRAMTAADPQRVHTVRLEELVAIDRERTFDRLVSFVGFEDREPLASYFDRRMNPDEGNVGRWRREMSRGEQRRFNDRYRRILGELEAKGVSCLPTPPELVDELAASP